MVPFEERILSKRREILLGNEAIARGLVEAGCTMTTSYPGTPASEIVGTLAKWKRQGRIAMHVEWSINEKVAFEVALANSYAGRRSAVSMKQVGLNVASDPLMSAAYTGVAGGFLVVVADDPGPHSSQTEQDSRFSAMGALLPVLDPADPREARDWIRPAFELSERYQVPVLLRPTTRVCHARQDLEVADGAESESAAQFKKDPARWAATPKFRFLLHQQLNDKIRRIALDPSFQPTLTNAGALAEAGSERARGACVVASGVVHAHAVELMQELGLWETLPLFRVRQPYPLSPTFRDRLLADYDRVLVLEETYPVIEWQLQDRTRVQGRTTGLVPNAGELLPEVLEDLLRTFADLPAAVRPQPPTAPGRRPTLCAGCPHRAAFHAIKKVFRKGIYPGDIGCYTLGLNLGAVDTVLCMGASISQATGFYFAHRKAAEAAPPIAATIGDSTFYHAGIPALINAVVQGARFVLVVLDNGTTAMTGHQPTPAGGISLDGRPVPKVLIEDLVRACGVKHLAVGDPYRYREFTALLHAAKAHTQADDGGIAVVIARRPCLMDRAQTSDWQAVQVRVGPDCQGCGICTSQFECPALEDRGKDQPIRIDPGLCSGCGVCIEICPHHALEVQ